MQNQPHKGSRPITVTFAVVLLSMSTVLAIIRMAVGAHLDNPLTYAVLGVVLGVSALMIWLIFRGRNWARWVFIILFALGLLLSPRSIQKLQTHSSFDVFFYCVQLLLQLAAAVALCLRPSREWFGGNNNAA